MTQSDRKNTLEKQLEGYPVALDPDQVAEVLGITRRTVDKLLNEEKLPYFAIDPEAARQQKRVTKGDLIDYMINNHYSKN